MASFESLDEGELADVDLDPSWVAQCLPLSEEANWNQVAADWSLLLGAGRGFGVAHANRLVASAVVMPFERRMAWISMVLVTVQWRRRGIATRLMRRALEYCDRRRLLPYLDATPAGARVYGTLGFHTVRRLTRWRFGEPAVAFATDRVSDVQSPTELDHGQLVRFDRRAYGEARSEVLRSLVIRSGACAAHSKHGCVLSRDGRTARHIGPLFSDVAREAPWLLAAALDQCATGEAVIVDAFDDARALSEMLDSAGFVAERPFLRMVRGRAAAAQPSLLHAAAGPELG